MIIALAALVGVAVLAVLREGAPRGKAADSVTPEPAFEHARGGVVRTLAIAEGKLLARNPLVIAGVVLGGISMFAAGRGTRLFHDDMGVALMLFPLAGMTLIASDLAVLRGRRDGLEEQFGSCPVGPIARTFAHSLALAGPVLYACIFAAAWTITSRAFGSIGRPNFVELLTGPILVVCAGLVGILLARLLPRSAASLFMVIAIGFLEGGLASERGHLKPLAPFMPTLYQPVEVETRPRGWHIVYLLGIAGVLAVAAIARHRRGPRIWSALGLAATVAISAAFAQYRAQTPARDARAAAWIATPEAFQTCRHHGLVTYCAYAEYTELLDRWRAPVDGVLALVPAPVRARPLVLRQRLPAEAISGMQRPEIRAALPFSVPRARPFVWSDDGAIHPDMTLCNHSREARCQIVLAESVAAWAVGLPIARIHPADPAAGDLPTEKERIAALGLMDSSGQARAVVALWLTLQATPGIRGAPPDTRARQSDQGTAYTLTPCQEGPPVAWSFEDTGYARRLAERPAAEVAARLASEWAVVTDPRTTTRQLAHMFDLQAPTLAMSIPPPTFHDC